MAETNINYHIDQQPTHATVTLLPGLNSAQWSEIEQAGTDIINRLDGMRSPAVMVDLTPLTYMGSSMVAMIVRFWKSVQSNDGRIIVVCDNDVVKEVISLAGLTKVWPIVASREDGMRALGVSGGLATEGRWLVISGIVAVLVGLVGAGLLFVGRVPPQVTLALLFAGAGIAFVLGLVTLVRSTTSARYWGLGILLAGTAIGIVGFISLVQRSAPPVVGAEAENPEANGQVADTVENMEAMTENEDGLPADGTP